MAPEVHHSPQTERSQRRLYRLRMTIIILTFAIIMTTAGIVAYNSVQQNDAQQQLLEIGQNEARNADQLKVLIERITDCTTPGKPCYDEGAKSQGQAVSKLVHMMIAANVCAARVDLKAGTLVAAVRRMLACITVVLLMLPK